MKEYFFAFFFLILSNALKVGILQKAYVLPIWGSYTCIAYLVTFWVGNLWMAHLGPFGVSTL